VRLQVFAILVEYIDRQDWKAAFEAVIPPRKFVVDKKRKRGIHDTCAGGEPAGEVDENGLQAEEGRRTNDGEGESERIDVPVASGNMDEEAVFNI
jgi:tRNA (guanine9-N1)-methyltransferase